MSDDINVYNKYMVSNLEWNKSISDSGGSVYGSMGELIYMHLTNSMGEVDDGTMSTIHKFNNIDCYYVRNVMRENSFFNIADDFYDGDKLNSLWKKYNSDPFGRMFPYFVNGDINYNVYNADGNFGVKYGYWIIYYDDIIISDAGLIGRRDNWYKMMSRIPCIILHSTTIEGISIGCLDVVER